MAAIVMTIFYCIVELVAFRKVQVSYPINALVMTLGTVLHPVIKIVSKTAQYSVPLLIIFAAFCLIAEHRRKNG